MVKEVGVRAVWDDEAGEWIAMGEGVPGLVAQAQTLETLFAKLSNKVSGFSHQLDPESQSWLESDLSRLGEHEPYDWGDLNPLTLGEPVEYIPGKGWVVGKA